jgi:hypothetical protein
LARQAYPVYETGKVRLILKICATGTDTTGTLSAHLFAYGQEGILRSEVVQMSTAEITNEPTVSQLKDSVAAPQAPSARSAGITDDPGNVLAQIPDLDPKSAPKRNSKRHDGRIIGQALSMKLVFGVGIGLVIGAVLPSLFNRGGHAPKSVRELPAWNAREAEAASPATASTLAPPWKAPQSQAMVVAPQIPAAGDSPQPPQGDVYLPATLRGAWTRPQTTAAAPAAPQPAGGVDPDYARLGPPPSRGDDRYYSSASDRRDAVADNRNDPATQYRDAASYDYRGNRIETPAARRDSQYPGSAPDYRYNTPDYRYNTPDPNGVRPGSPLMPSGPSGAGAYYGNPQDNNSGVARFQGTIAPPPRTN